MLCIIYRLRLVLYGDVKEQVFGEKVSIRKSIECGFHVDVTFGLINVEKCENEHLVY